MSRTLWRRVPVEVKFLLVVGLFLSWHVLFNQWQEGFLFFSPRPWEHYDVQLPDGQGTLVFWRRWAPPFNEFDFKIEVAAGGRGPRTFAIGQAWRHPVYVWLVERGRERFLGFGEDYLVRLDGLTVLEAEWPYEDAVGKYVFGDRGQISFVSQAGGDGSP